MSNGEELTELDEFEAEVKHRFGRKVEGPEIPGKPEVWWSISADQLFSDENRHLNLELQLRRVPTALPLVTQYAHLQFDDPELMTAARNKSLRRLVQVYPPKFLLEALPLEVRYRDVIVPAGAVTVEEIGSSLWFAQHTYGKHNREALLDEGSPARLREGLVLGVCDQNWWVHSGVPVERLGRKETGLYRMPWWVVRERFHDRLIALDLLDKLDKVKQREPIGPEEELSVIYSLAQGRLDAAQYGRGTTEEEGYFTHANCWEAFTQHERMLRDRNPLAELYRLGQLNTTERFANMYYAHDLLRKPPKRDGRGHEAISPEYDFCQTIGESIEVEEKLLDMVSTVFGEPLLLIHQTVMPRKDRDGNDKEEKKLWVAVRHVELVIFASVDEFNDLRKTVDHRKQWLGLRRAEALALLAPARLTGAPDNWYLGATDDQPLRNLIFSEVVDPKIYLGYLWELAESWAQISGGDPLDYRIRPAPELGGWHLRGMQSLFESFNTLLDLAEQVRNGGKISDADMRDKHLPKLVQYPKELIRWTFWDYKGNRAILPHLTHAPGRLPHAVPYRDFALWYDWWWVMGNDHYVFLQLVAYVNQRFAEAGLPVRVTCDGPDSNYFRHHDIAWEIWRNQPAEPLEARFRRELREAEDTGVVELRPIIRRQFSGLPVIHGDGRQDLFWLLGQLHEVADELYDDFVAEISHAFNGTSRGVSFALTGSALQGGYRRGVSIHTPEEQHNLRLGLVEIPLKSKYYDNIRGVLEALQYDPFLLRKDDKVKAAVTSLLMSRGLTRVYANKLTERIEKMRGVFGLPVLFDPDETREVPLAEENWLHEEIRLLGGLRLLRLESGRMYADRWVTLEGDLIVPQSQYSLGPLVQAKS